MTETLDSIRAYRFEGATTVVAARADQRVSYCLYVPSRREGDPARYPLAVMQHGTGRTAWTYRDEMIEFAERQRVVILAPLFPAGLIDPLDLHNFKTLVYRDIRFDLLLLSIVDEVALHVPIEPERFLLHGFSAGAQFAHRFFYVHPERLLGVSVGAPGRLTLLDDAESWWLGTADLEAVFGKPLDLEQMRRVACQLVVGAEDLDESEINDETASNWRPEIAAQGRTRIDRIRTLQRNWQDHGIDAALDIVQGTGHEGTKLLPAVRSFFETVLTAADR